MRQDLAHILRWIEPGARVLDLGCGDGDQTERVAEFVAGRWTAAGYDGFETNFRSLEHSFDSPTPMRREIEARGGVGPLQSRDDLFHDNIHFSEYGAYLMALTHYTVLYGRSPVGLPHGLTTFDGTPAADPGPEAARMMQEVVWRVVTSYAPTGVSVEAG